MIVENNDIYSVYIIFSLHFNILSDICCLLVFFIFTFSLSNINRYIAMKIFVFPTIKFNIRLNSRSEISNRFFCFDLFFVNNQFVAVFSSTCASSFNLCNINCNVRPFLPYGSCGIIIKSSQNVKPTTRSLMISSQTVKENRLQFQNKSIHISMRYKLFPEFFFSSVKILTRTFIQQIRIVVI